MDHPLGSETTPQTGSPSRMKPSWMFLGLLVLGMAALGWNFRESIQKRLFHAQAGSDASSEVPGEVMLKYDDAVSDLSEIRNDYEDALRRGMTINALSQHLALYTRALITLHKQCKSITGKYTGSDVRKVEAMQARVAGEYDELISYCLDQGMTLASGMPRQLE